MFYAARHVACVERASRQVSYLKSDCDLCGEIGWTSKEGVLLPLLLWWLKLLRRRQMPCMVNALRMYSVE